MKPRTLILPILAAASIAFAAQQPSPAAQKSRAAQAQTGPAVRPAAPRVARRQSVVSPAASEPVAPPTAVMSTADQDKIVSGVCSTCHNEVNLSGNLSLEAFESAKAADHAELVEKMIKKLRAGMMPPATLTKRPSPAEINAFATALETRLDQAAALKPNPGHRPFQRFSRAEYALAVKNLVGITVDATAFLPPDTISAGFDNVADVQNFSPTVMEGYLRAAAYVSTVAVGDPDAAPGETSFKTDRTASQLEHVDGAPWGTRGGISVVHNFPADGEYSFRITLHSIPTGQLFGSTVKGEQVEVSVNGERVALLPINQRMSESDPTGMAMTTPRVHVKAGPQRVSAAFLQRFEAPMDDLLMPIDYTLADTQIGSGFGVTALPHLRAFAITGPFKVTGVSDTPSRRRIFSCRPTQPSEELGCAQEIVKRLAQTAYRGSVSTREFDGLMNLYKGAREKGDFESGVRMALQAVLASPRFLFRLEQVPTTVKVGEAYKVTDSDLATRLSFFLWGSAPDDELLKAASLGSLRTSFGLEKQVKRMLQDPRAETLSTRFAYQWLRLQDLPNLKPDALLYPLYDATLAESFRRETELFFGSIVSEDRDVLDLVTADYTFVNERVARHYGIPNVTGSAFRRVSLQGTPRRGLLGQGSILALTSVADRTSPVQRGKWVLEVLWGSPPPPPPPNVPDLAETKAVGVSGRTMSVRERLEEHRKNPACRSCHRIIDPLGLALENFDVDGRWRIRDNGVAVDAAGQLYDGTPLAGPDDLRQALLKHQEPILRSFTEYLFTYALGRRVEASDMPTVRSIVKGARANGNRFSSYVLGIVKSPAFQMNLASQPGKTRTAEMPNDSSGASPDNFGRKP